jgi:uncharacterized NAD(P)/FAD-binding protein YdhS
MSDFLQTPTMSQPNWPATYSAETATVAIIGGGASGLIAAVQLIQRTRRAIKIVFVEPRASLGSGVAYSTEFDSHLLNVPAGNMSPLHDDPDHFSRWMRTNVARNFDRRSFARRSLYGNYLGETLAEACLLAQQQISLDHYRSRATHVETNRCGARVWMENGLRISADRVVLALGNPPQENPMPAGSGVEAVSAWSRSSFDGLEPDAPLLLVGAGLTAVDAVLALDERGHRGTIHVVSRHGKWPLAHGASTAPIPSGPPRSATTARSILRAIRKQAAAAGGGWHAAVDALRPHTNGLWMRASDRERQRFHRHLRFYWQIHRHRMPQEAATKIHSMRWDGRVLNHSGRIIEARIENDSRLRVRVALRGGRDDLCLEVARIINCTGPSANLRDWPHSLIHDLLETGIVRTDSLGQGLLTDNDGALIGRDGAQSNVVFTLGPMRRGTLLETTAIPEIREQAASLVGRLLAQINSTPLHHQASDLTESFAAGVD